MNTFMSVAFQGQIVANAYKQLTLGRDATYESTEKWNKISHAFQSKVNSLIMTCYRTIDTYVKEDISDAAYQEGPTVQEAANQLRTRLETKYDWTKWIVIVNGIAGDQNDRYPTRALIRDGRGYWFDPMQDTGSGKRRSVVAVPLPKINGCAKVFPSRAWDILSGRMADCSVDSSNRPWHCNPLKEIVTAIDAQLIQRLLVPVDYV